MPGLRFKKRAARRSTIDNLDQNAKDIEAAKVEQAQKKKENEKFLQLFKSKYPNHAKDVNLPVDDVKDSKAHANGHVPSGKEHSKCVSPTTGRVLCSPVSIKRSNSLTNKQNDYLFLRYHGEMRRIAMPKILTMAGLKKLFADAFNLDRSVTHWPDGVLYIQDRYTDQWSELLDPGQAIDSGILLLRDLNQSGLPLLNNNTALDTDSTDVSTTQSPVVMHHDSHSQINSHPKRPHKYESIDDFSKQNRSRGSSSSLSRDATPPMVANQQSSSTNTPKLSRRISANSAMAERKINEMTTHIVSGGRHFTNSMTSIASGGSPDQLVKSVKQTHRAVRQVKSDYQVLRALYSRQLQTFEHFMKYSCSQIMTHIRAANLSTVRPSSSLRMKRLEIDPEEETYQAQAHETFHDFRLLEAALHEITVDVTQRQCRVNGAEVERLASAVASSARALIELQQRYLPLEDALKDVMERELEVIIMEERLIKEEGHNLEEAIIKCKDMTETLLSLRKLATSDANRSLIVPMIQAVAEPDKEALMDNIQAITPNHEARMQSIAVAEETYRKKKQVLMLDQVKIMARDLQNGRLQLRSIVPINELERRREHQLRQLYLQEKSEKEQQHQIVNQQHQITNQDVAQMALARRKELERIRNEEQRKEEKRLKEQRAEQQRAEQRRAEQHKEEQRRAEEHRPEQRRAEQRKAEQRRAEERRAEQQRAEQRKEEQRRAEERKAKQQRAEQHRKEQQREDKLRAECTTEDVDDEHQRAEERREQQRREERRVEEQMAEQRKAQERREDQRRAERRAEEQRAQQRRELRRAEEHRELRWAEERRAELRRIEERREELRRMEERREELRREEEYRKELYLAEQLREEQQRAEEQRKLEEANMPKDHQQRVAAEELLRRVTGETSTSIKFGQVKRQSVTMEEPPMKKQNNNRTPMNHWYNSTSSSVPLGNSTLIQSSEQWRRSASSTQPRPKSMEILDFSIPQHLPHRREGPIGGYPSPPNHHPPSISQSANPTRHQTRFPDKPPNHRANTLGHHHMTAVVHPAPPQTHHNQLDNGFKDHSSKVLNNYPVPSRPAPPPPPTRREPYKTTYKNTEHGPTLYSMV